jgi:hypothetical protein
MYGESIAMSKNLQMEKLDMYNTTSIYLILQTNPDIHQLPSKTQIAFDLKPKGTKQKRKILYARMGRCPQSAPLHPVSVLCVSTVSVFCCLFVVPFTLLRTPMLFCCLVGPFFLLLALFYELGTFVSSCYSMI